MNIEHFNLLMSGVEAFNEFRRNNPETVIDLSGANMSGANMRGADMRRANMSGADMIRANMSGADMSGADMRGANMRGANMSDANMIRANMSGANMIRANMIRANMRGANLDISCLPLWCGSLKMKTDERQRIQIAFHFASLIAYCENATEEEKKIYNELLPYVNRFHREDVYRLTPIQ